MPRTAAHALTILRGELENLVEKMCAWMLKCDRAASLFEEAVTLSRIVEQLFG